MLALGTCKGLDALHKQSFVHHDVRASNHVWADPDKQRVVLIDCTDAGPSGKRPDQALLTTRRGWSNMAGGTDILDDGLYTERSDMHMAGLMLLQYSHLLLRNMHKFCRKLEQKELTASEALAALQGMPC